MVAQEGQMELLENTLRDQQWIFLELSQLLISMEKKLDQLLSCSAASSLPPADILAVLNPLQLAFVLITQTLVPSSQTSLTSMVSASILNPTDIFEIITPPSDLFARIVGDPKIFQPLSIL
ncbi:hypothetical protein NE237_016553 [Protea cynaroides]|uniref:Uncharacterized protein n=1 Tax=Protea cynaroides TaxID=273540 RepID=A0A9Q0HIR2_9MAGN|nr:hypothetical protein NE237_016553 [Protea cynaroides]